MNTSGIFTALIAAYLPNDHLGIRLARSTSVMMLILAVVLSIWPLTHPHGCMTASRCCVLRTPLFLQRHCFRGKGVVEIGDYGRMGIASQRMLIPSQRSACENMFAVRSGVKHSDPTGSDTASSRPHRLVHTRHASDPSCPQNCSKGVALQRRIS